MRRSLWLPPRPKCGGSFVELAGSSLPVGVTVGPGCGSVAPDYADHSKTATSGTVTAESMLAAVWCRSVGAGWTLELRELGSGTELGPIVDWISSGVPVTEPEPEVQARQLLAARGLRLFRQTADGGTRSRYQIGFVCPTPS